MRSVRRERSEKCREGKSVECGERSCCCDLNELHLTIQFQLHCITYYCVVRCGMARHCAALHNFFLFEVNCTALPVTSYHRLPFYECEWHGCHVSQVRGQGSG